MGCSSGALAREYKKINPTCHYIGVDINQASTELAKDHCDLVYTLNIEQAGDEFFNKHRHFDCWIFGDVLEHLIDPWSLLQKIRSIITHNGCLVSCIPNAQHWSLQARLNRGFFNYEPSGLLDTTHLRWFTRHTIIDLFQNAGFRIETMLPRIIDEPHRDRFLPMIGEFGKLTGGDPEITIRDSIPLQYIIKAFPA